MDEDTSWQKQLLVGVGLLILVGLLVGGLIAVVALKAADVAGVGDKRIQSTEPPPGLGPSTPNNPADTRTTSAQTSSTSPPTSSRAPRRAIRLVASPKEATTYERVNLTGTYRNAPSGANLQVQRAEGGDWADFPTTASVAADTFATYIETGRSGVNRFRVVDTGTGKASNVVVVVIR